MCRSCHYAQAILTNPALSAMTNDQLKELLQKYGHKGIDIRDEGVGRIGIITDDNVDKHLQEVIESCLPAGVQAFFTTRVKEKLPLPKVLEKWAKDAAKYMGKKS